MIDFLLNLLFTTSTLTVIGIFLFKKFVSHRLERDLKKFETDLTIQAATQMEAFKSQVALESMRNQRKFETIYLKQVDAVVKLHKAICECQPAVQACATFHDDQTAGSNFQKAKGALEELFKIHEESLIWFPKELGQKTQEFINTSWKTVNDFTGHYLTLKTSPSSEKFRSWQETCQRFDKEISSTREVILQQFQILVGSREEPGFNDNK